MSRLKTISESLKPKPEHKMRLRLKKVNETRSEDIWDRITRYEDALGVEELLKNIVIKAGTDDMAGILDSIAQDYGLDDAEGPEEEEEEDDDPDYDGPQDKEAWSGGFAKTH